MNKDDKLNTIRNALVDFFASNLVFAPNNFTHQAESILAGLETAQKQEDEAPEYTYTIRKGETVADITVSEIFSGWVWEHNVPGSTAIYADKGGLESRDAALESARMYVEDLEADRIEREEQEENDLLYGTYEQQVRRDYASSRF